MGRRLFTLQVIVVSSVSLTGCVVVGDFEIVTGNALDGPRRILTSNPEKSMLTDFGVELAAGLVLLAVTGLVGIVARKQGRRRLN